MPEPPRQVLRNTVADAALGRNLTLTAAVDRRISDMSFVVRDADLPEGGLLVVTREPVAVGPPVLVTVTGTVAMFNRADFGWLRWDQHSGYAQFEGHRIVVARQVHIWSPARLSPRPTGGERRARPDGRVRE